MTQTRGYAVVVRIEFHDTVPTDPCAIAEWVVVNLAGRPGLLDWAHRYPMPCPCGTCGRPRPEDYPLRDERAAEVVLLLDNACHPQEWLRRHFRFNPDIRDVPEIQTRVVEIREPYAKGSFVRASTVYTVNPELFPRDDP